MSSDFQAHPAGIEISIGINWSVEGRVVSYWNPISGLRISHLGSILRVVGY